MLTPLPLLALLAWGAWAPASGSLPTAPAPPSPSEPAPAEPAPAENAPAQTAPPAKPAPPPPAPEPEAPPPPPAAALAVTAGVAIRLPPDGRDIPPAVGFTLSTFGGYRYALVGDVLALGGAGAFAFQRFARSFQSLVPASPTYVRELTLGEFSALQTATLLLGRARPFLAAGGGISLGHYHSPENPARPDEQRVTQPILDGQTGVDVEIKPNVDLGVHAELVVPLSRPTLHAENGTDVHVFGPRVSVRLGFQYRF